MSRCCFRKDERAGGEAGKGMPRTGVRAVIESVQCGEVAAADLRLGASEQVDTLAAAPVTFKRTTPLNCALPGPRRR
jgi:hypothetical protein